MDSIPENVKARAQVVMQAAKEDALGIIPCTDKETGKVAYVLAMLVEGKDEFAASPLFVIDERDPTEIVNPPEDMEMQEEHTH